MTRYEFVRRGDPSAKRSGDLTAWDTYRNHRDIVTGTIVDRSPEHAGSLCILGAGFCLDIELKQLSRRFPKITLVDLNESDLVAGLKAQGFTPNSQFRICGGVDICGIHQSLQDFRELPTDNALDSLIDQAAIFSPDLAREFDCVASTCVLSQLLCHAAECVSEDHTRFVELLRSIRLRHIQIMMQSLRPGGRGMLFTDFVSSESLPELFETADVTATVEQAIANNNFLHGLNPAAIRRTFSHQSIATRINSLKVTNPWRWVMPERVYACVAVVFELI